MSARAEFRHIIPGPGRTSQPGREIRHVIGALKLLYFTLTIFFSIYQESDIYIVKKGKWLGVMRHYRKQRELRPENGQRLNVNG